MVMSSKKEADLHVALFPWLGFGHLIPYLEIAKHLARRGHKVSFISTPRNIQRLPKIPPNLAPSITFVQLPLPRVQSLPENAESTRDIPDHQIPDLFLAIDGLENQVSDFLEAQTPDWLIYDFNAHWLPPIAAKLGISRATCSIVAASALCSQGDITPELIDRYDVLKPLPFTSKPAAAAPEKETPVDAGFAFKYRLEATIEGCEVFLVRNCEEVEGDWLGLLQEVYKKPVVPLGLLLPPLTTAEAEVEGDQVHDADKQDNWCYFLDKQEKGSVVYVAFGSEVQVSQQNITELALGLELSGLPFLWAFRTGNPSLSEGHGSGECGGDGSSPVKLPDGFEDRVKGRGVVWKTWAPQHKILAHDSVGGFLTHCGWGSILEGLYYGHPLIMFPVASEQFLSAKLWEEKKVGVRVPRDEQNGSHRTSFAETLKLVMVDDEKGNTYKDRAKDYSSKLKGDKGLPNYRDIDKCIEYLEIHRRASFMDK